MRLQDLVEMDNIETVDKHKHQMQLISANIYSYRLIDDPVEEVQLAVAEVLGGYILEHVLKRGIIPSQRVVDAATKRGLGRFINEISKYSDKIKLNHELLVSPSNIGNITRKNVLQDLGITDQDILNTITKNGKNIRLLIDKRKGIYPSKDIQLQAVKQRAATVRYFIDERKGIYPDKEVLDAAIKKNIGIIRYVRPTDVDYSLIEKLSIKKPQDFLEWLKQLHKKGLLTKQFFNSKPSKRAIMTSSNGNINMFWLVMSLKHDDLSLDLFTKDFIYQILTDEQLVTSTDFYSAKKYEEFVKLVYSSSSIMTNKWILFRQRMLDQAKKQR